MPLKPYPNTVFQCLSAFQFRASPPQTSIDWKGACPCHKGPGGNAFIHLCICKNVRTVYGSIYSAVANILLHDGWNSIVVCEATRNPPSHATA